MSPHDDDDVEVVGEDNPFANVFTFGRKDFGEVVPYLPPEPTPRDKIIAKEIDEDAVLMLEELLERFKSGEAHGLAAAAGKFDENGNFLDAAILLSDVAWTYPLSFMGAVTDLSHAISEERLSSEGEGCALRALELIEYEADN